MEPVLEISGLERFRLWPVAELRPYSCLPLNGAMSPAEVGTAIAVIAGYNDQASNPDSRRETSADGFIGPLLASDTVIARGGLRVRDSDTGAVLTPGCCCGLEDWREWLDVVRGEDVWLGHDPTPGIEHSEGTVRIRPDDHTPDTVIELPMARVPQLLISVQQDLVGFLTATTLWSRQYAPGSSPALAAALDSGFQITAPLPL